MVGGWPAGDPLGWLEDQDPAFVELTRTVQIGLAFVLGIMVGVATEKALGLGLPLQFPMFATMGAVAHLLFLAPASRRRELRDLARLSAFILFCLGIQILWSGGSELSQSVMHPAPPVPPI